MRFRNRRRTIIINDYVAARKGDLIMCSRPVSPIALKEFKFRVNSLFPFHIGGEPLDKKSLKFF